jgi:hypothetical protein
MFMEHPVWWEYHEERSFDVGDESPLYGSAAGSLVPRALYEYLWPARVAAYIRPPLAIVNTAIPFTYPPAVVALFTVPLALAVVPVVPTDAPAEAVIAVALAPALNSNFPLRNMSSAALFSKKMIWL